MGIQGLLTRLKSVCQSESLQTYENQVVVVDAMSWLHKGCYACARQIALGQNCSRIYLNFMMKRIELLMKYNVKPLIVFDGRRAPLKANTSQNRKGARDDNLQKGFAFYAKSNETDNTEKRNKLRTLADVHFQRAVKPTEQIIMNVINEFRRKGISFVVAPYEADAQMVWLCKTKQASAIITEDSDLLVYCAAANVDCPILFKLDEYGHVKMLSLSILRLFSFSGEADKFIEKFQQLLDTPEERRMFVQFCVLSGCDFLESLPSVGIVTAQKLVIVLKQENGYETVRRVLKHLQQTNGKEIPEDYFERFCSAEALFYHHIIYNSETQQCQFLVDPKESFPEIRKHVIKKNSGPVEISSCLGQMIDASLAAKIYAGLVNPRVDHTARRESMGGRISTVPKSPRRRNNKRRQSQVDIGTMYRQYAENVQPRENQAQNNPIDIIEIDITPEKPVAPPVRRLVRSAPRRLLEDFIPVNERRTKKMRLQGVLNMGRSSTADSRKKGQKRPVKITDFFSRKP